MLEISAMKITATVGIVMLVTGCATRISTDFPPSQRARSKFVYPGRDGGLVFAPDEKGNIIPDFSNAGYMGGGVKIPDVGVKATVWPAKGDDGARIQAAIDKVSRRKPDPNGFRGAVLLQKGKYEVAGSLYIKRGGVVLRGEGQGKDGTVLVATGESKRTLIEIGIAEPLRERKFLRPRRSPTWREVTGTRRRIIDDYVPVGARSFHVESTEGLKVGHTVIVHRPSTKEWIQTLGMDRIPPRRDGRRIKQWAPGKYDLLFDRVITQIKGNKITIDAPLVNAFQKEFGGGWIYRYTFPERIQQVGVENLRAVSVFKEQDDEDHAWTLISLDAVENGWVRQITGVHFAYSCVHVLKHAKWITVEDSACLDPISEIRGGRRYPFALRGQLTLVQRCRTRNGRHSFIMHARVPGPNVFLDCTANDEYNDSGPHHRWATGTLFDNVRVSRNRYSRSRAAGALRVENRLNKGSGHGWAGAQMVFWNSTADSITCENPPTAQNWAIGCRANYKSGDCHWDSFGKPVEPRSLYLKQLEERLGKNAVANIAKEK